LFLHEIEEKARAFYSQRTIDFEYTYPFGQKELYGLAYRTNYDLLQHQKYSGQSFEYTDPETKEKYVPHVIEPSLGVDRSFLVALLEAYTEVDGGRTTTTESTKEVEIVLKLPYELAPIKVAILPLSKKEPLLLQAQAIAQNLSFYFTVQYDITGSIGRRYRRQDEIGTPYCLTVDFETANDKSVTVRDRDTMQQERIKIDSLLEYFKQKFIHV
jgi:glycyl-tRNA synthetase